jgi:dipeptidase
LSFGQIDLDDAANFLASSDLISYAVARGWYDPAGGEAFCFRKVYRLDRADQPDPRRWRGRQLAAGCDDPWPPACPPPVGIKPKQKLTVEALARILRFTGSPGTLSTPSTQEAAIFQLRQDLPPAVGCIYWRTTAEPATSVCTPWYVGISQTPANYYRPVEIRE